MRYIDPYRDSIDNVYAYPGICKPYLLILKQDTPVPFLVPPELPEPQESPEKNSKNGNEAPEDGGAEKNSDDAQKKIRKHRRWRSTKRAWGNGYSSSPK